MRGREKFFMKKSIAAALFSLLVCSVLTTPVWAQELVVGGQAVGIQVGTDGVLVAGLTQVETGDGSKSPASAAGIKKGDLITEINGTQVQKAAELIEQVGALGGKPAELTVQRDSKTLRVTVQPIESAEGQWMMGMWLRDGISGIGTVTFCDPATGIYGALGHSISDADTGSPMQLGEGTITDAEIVSITKGASGAPGELNGCADMGRVLGSVDNNTAHGIFGRAYAALGSRTLETGKIATGPATIVSTIGGRQPQEYKIEVNRIYRDAEGEHVMLTVTDPELCARTGGIVQGMSGSPILQNGRLVGAVTHVFVNDPTRGYGVSIQDMLNSAGIEEKAA